MERGEQARAPAAPTCSLLMLPTLEGAWERGMNVLFLHEAQGELMWLNYTILTQVNYKRKPQQAGPH